MDLLKIQTVVEPVLKEIGCEWVDGKLVFEQGRKILRLLIEKTVPSEGLAEGQDVRVTLDDCVKASREVGTLLEVEDLIDDRCVLEVSSPGLNRPLNKESDYLKYLGKMASLKTRMPIENRRNYKGVLQRFENNEVIILIDGKEYKVPLDLIEKANLVAA